jgi:uncharacterized RDD family membrane protein YckC
MSAIPEPPAQTGDPWALVGLGGEDQLPVPPSAAPPGQEELMGLRISAALVDLAVLLGLFLVLSVATGGASWDQGPRFDLGGGALFLFSVIALGYYFALEAAFGQTVGKYLLGLRVVRPDGSRPSMSAITGRTVLRIVDWLPLLYLVGFITMMATGGRRQRLGDLAARTRMGRASPAAHRGIIAIVVTVVLLGVAAVAVQQAAVSDEGSDGGSGTYRAHGVSFDYPVGWQESGLEHVVTGGDANELWRTAVTRSGGFDLVIVSAYRLNFPVTAQNLDAVTPEFVSAVQQYAEQLGGVVQAGPEEFTMAGLPGLRFHITGTMDGTAVRSTLIFAFDGNTEYFLNCQHTPGGLAEIQRGCDQIIRTFTVNP